MRPKTALEKYYICYMNGMKYLNVLNHTVSIHMSHSVIIFQLYLYCLVVLSAINSSLPPPVSTPDCCSPDVSWMSPGCSSGRRAGGRVSEALSRGSTAHTWDLGAHLQTQTVAHEVALLASEYNPSTLFCKVPVLESN